MQSIATIARREAIDHDEVPGRPGGTEAHPTRHPVRPRWLLTEPGMGYAFSQGRRLFDPFRHHCRAPFWSLVTPPSVAGAGSGPGDGAGRPGCLRRGISVDHGCRLRPVSGTARGVLASRLVSAVQQPKTITRLSRQSSGQGTVDPSRAQPSRTSAVMTSIWDR